MAAELLSLMDSFNFVQHVSGPTHIKGHTLDLVFSLGLNINQLTVVDYPVSDHCSILFDMSLNMAPSACHVVSNRRIFNETTISDFFCSFQAKYFF